MKPMHVLLVNLPDPYDVNPHLMRERHERHLPPLGMAYVAATLLAEGHTVELIDGAFPKLGSSASRTDDIFGKILAGNYDVVGLYLTVLGLHWGLYLARRVRNALPNTWIIAGGPQPTITTESFLAQNPEIDVVVRGEGERTMCELLRRRQQDLAIDNVAGIAYQAAGGVRLTETRQLINDLDSLPWPARDLLPSLADYAHIRDPHTGRPCAATSMITSRGCPFHCTFCSMPTYARANRGKRWRARSAASVAEEAKHVVRNFGIERIIFCDDHFLLDIERVRCLAQEWQAQNVGATFSFSARVTQVIRATPILSQLRRVGCTTIEIGVESGSQRILDILRKGTTVDQNRVAIQTLLNHGIVPVVDFIMFVPDTTLDDLEKNLTFYEEINSLHYFPFRWQNKLVPLPGTQATVELGLDDSTVDWAAGPLDYDFTDAAVGQVYAAIQRFEAETAWRTWLDRCEQLANVNGQQTTPRWQANLRLMQTILRRLPLFVFRQLLAMARSGRLEIEISSLIYKTKSHLDRLKNRIEALEAAVSVNEHILITE